MRNKYRKPKCYRKLVKTKSGLRIKLIHIVRGGENERNTD